MSTEPEYKLKIIKAESYHVGWSGQCSTLLAYCSADLFPGVDGSRIVRKEYKWGGGAHIPTMYGDGYPAEINWQHVDNKLHEAQRDLLACEMDDNGGDKWKEEYEKRKVTFGEQRKEAIEKFKEKIK